MNSGILVVGVLLTAVSSYADDPLPLNDLTVTGQVGVGTGLPRARLELAIAESDQFGIKVLDAEGRHLFEIDNKGYWGIGIPEPQARMDVRHGLLVRSGTTWLRQHGYAIGFASPEENSSRFILTTRHTDTFQSPNAIDLWFRRSGERGRGSRALTLETAGSELSCGISISPAATAAFELDIASGGDVPGVGTMRYGHAGTIPHARNQRTRILDESHQKRAYDELKTLRLVSFQVKGDPVARRGLLAEDAPESLRGPRGTVIVDERVAGLELALQAIHRKIRLLEDAVEQEERVRGD